MEARGRLGEFQAAPPLRQEVEDALGADASGSVGWAVGNA